MADTSETRRVARIVRVYHNGPLQPGSELTLDKSASHHLITVLRTKAEDNVVLFNGDGHEYPAQLLNIDQRNAHKQALLKIGSCELGIPESPLAITLVQCVSRPERMDISLRQAVELGVSRIQPVYSKHSIKVTDNKRAQKKQEHWQNIVINACEQSGRSVTPELCTASTYTQWLQDLSEVEQALFVLSPQATHSLTARASVLAREAECTKVTVIIGPESGLDADEIQDAVLRGAVPVQLGPRILRTETAGPACIMLLQSILGDLQA